MLKCQNLIMKGTRKTPPSFSMSGVSTLVCSGGYEMTLVLNFKGIILSHNLPALMKME